MGKAMVVSETIKSIVENIFFQNNMIWDSATEQYILSYSIDATGNKNAVNGVLNLDFYCRKKRLTKDRNNNIIDTLMLGNCLIEYDNERIFNENVDFNNVSIDLTFLINTNTIFALEYLLESINVDLCGKKTGIKINGETKYITCDISSIQTREIQSNSYIAEAGIFTCTLEMTLSDNLILLSDYKFELAIVDEQQNSENNSLLPYQELRAVGFNYGKVMSSNSTPYQIAPQNTGELNFSAALVFNIQYYDCDDNIVIALDDATLSLSFAVNTPIYFRLTKFKNNKEKKRVYEYRCVMVSNKNNISDTTPSICELSLALRGKK